jgi:type IV pilus assembly protein PilB
MLELGLKPEYCEGKSFFRGVGCASCSNTGYKGRVGLFELMIMDDELRDMINDNCNTDDLRNRAEAKGMRLLRDMGVELAFDGTTTAEEVVRETVLDA